MCDIIKKKLGVENNEKPITVLDYLNIFIRIIDSVAVEKLQMKPLYSTSLKVSNVKKKCFVWLINFYLARTPDKAFGNCDGKLSLRKLSTYSCSS